MSISAKLHQCPHGKILAQATLNNPKSLNSLSLEMIEQLYRNLEEWRDNSNIAAILIDADGTKAFCAGGDIVRLYQGMKAADGYPERFFEQEYRLDYLIHNYPKPIVIWAEGIVMGGGMGIMQGGVIRIATETTTLAMPEISIGLYPDVGATYFLKNCPDLTGLYLALTGTRVNAKEALWLDFADVLIASKERINFFNSLLQIAFEGNFDNDLLKIQDLAKGMSNATGDLLINNLVANKEAIDSLLENVQNALEFEERVLKCSHNSAWIQKGLQNVKRASPSSLGIIFEQFKRGQSLSLKESFKLEWIISVQCSKHPDFREGVRALLIDKDNKPQWTPAFVSELRNDWILGHFVLPENYETNPLEDLH